MVTLYTSSGNELFIFEADWMQKLFDSRASMAHTHTQKKKVRQRGTNNKWASTLHRRDGRAMSNEITPPSFSFWPTDTGRVSLLTIANPIYNMYNTSTMTTTRFIFHKEPSNTATRSSYFAVKKRAKVGCVQLSVHHDYGETWQLLPMEILVLVQTCQ